eukprot:CAMPEP_0197631760 /NCGR_PEP_ID=MMETSP1338-20131121/8824_1 /TAXON_ID=43686 ORGANISM="Pelagodinium beii, Strain RCC1491" /NCGR_SAMPLE_ID=MMETSP1338 /ASSEMBLY_ACC=CAM_ASM_000754 /LENGTH=216 /DNA_ID=CAMNT_0043203291 /DNA_START=213 /DNA_END=863 /DNA_ORIENTATION=-
MAKSKSAGQPSTSASLASAAGSSMCSVAAQGSHPGSGSDEVQTARSHSFSARSNSHFVSELQSALQAAKEVWLVDMDDEEDLAAHAGCESLLTETDEALELLEGSRLGYASSDESRADLNALAQLSQQAGSSDKIVHRRSCGSLPAPSSLPACLYSIDEGDEGDEHEGESPRSAAKPSTSKAFCSPRPPQGPSPASRNPVGSLGTRQLFKRYTIGL